MDLAWHRCNIHYYLREKYYGNVKKISNEALQQNPRNSEFIFYTGIALILEGQVHKGISELTPLQSDSEIQLAVIIALVYAYKVSNLPEKEVLFNLESKLKEEK